MATSDSSITSETLGGVHADFAAGLGRKVRTLIASFDAVDWTEATRLVTQIRSGAKVLKLGALCIQAEDLLAALNEEPSATAEDFRKGLSVWRGRVSDWPGLAWTQSPSIVPASLLPAAADPLDVLVWGPEALAEAVRARGVYEVKAVQSGKAEESLDWTSVRLVVVDTSVPGAENWVEEAQVRNVPVVVIVQHAATSATWRAQGATAVLTAPVNPAALRRVVATWLREAAPASTDFAGVWAVGEVANRAADAICDALMPSEIQSRGLQIDFGDGREISQALARAGHELRALVAARTGTALAFDDVPASASFSPCSWAFGAASDTSAATWHADALRGARVLLAEDDPATRWHFAGLLRSHGCVVVEASDGAEALSVLTQSEPIDLVLVDLLMPRSDGFAVRDAVLADVCMHSTPVFLLSWKDDWLEVAVARGADPRWMARKDVASATFLTAIAEALAPATSLRARLGKAGLPLALRAETLNPFAIGTALIEQYAESEMVLQNSEARVTLGFADGHVVYARAWVGEAPLETGVAALRVALLMRRGDVTLREGRDSLATTDMHLPWCEIPALLRKPLQSSIAPEASRMDQVSPHSRSPRSLWELSSMPVQADYMPRDGRAVPLPGYLLTAELSNTPVDHITTHVDATLYGMPVDSRVLVKE